MKLLKNSFLGTVFLFAVSSSPINASHLTNNDAEEISYDCVEYTLSCGYGGLACDMGSTGELIDEVLYWEDELC